MQPEPSTPTPMSIVDREPEVLFPAPVSHSWKAKAAKWIAGRRQEPDMADIGEVLGMLLVEMQRAEAAEARCKALEREFHRLANWMQGADARMEHTEARLEAAGIPTLNVEGPVNDEFEFGMTPVGFRCSRHGIAYKAGESCSMCEPSVPALRGYDPSEPRVIVIRQASTVEARKFGLREQEVA